MKNSFFDQMVKQHGHNWINIVSPEQIQRNLNRILRDIAYGNINLEAYSDYFTNKIFIGNLKSKSQVLAEENSFISYSINFTAYATGDRCPITDVNRYIKKYNDISKLYSICTHYFSMMEYYILNDDGSGICRYNIIQSLPPFMASIKELKHCIL